MAKNKLEIAAARLIEVIRKQEGVGVHPAVWIEAVHDLQRGIGEVPTCQYCGCTDSKSCFLAGCFWIAPTRCSACEGMP